MPLTIEFKEIVRDRIRREPEFGLEMLAGAMEACINNEFAVGKLMLRDYINGTIGFRKLASVTGRNEKSLMRMLSPSGNPQMANFFLMIKELLVHTHAEIIVSSRAVRRVSKPKAASNH